jgi:hypothetical protein
LNEQPDTERSQTPSIDYDYPPVTELELDGAHYRVDAGLGAEVAVSRRAEGSWTWEQLAQGRWDGVRLKAKALDRVLVEALARALRTAASD